MRDLAPKEADPELVDKILKSSHNLQLSYDETYMRELGKQFSYQVLPITDPRLISSFDNYMREFKMYAEAKIYSETMPLGSFIGQL